MFVVLSQYREEVAGLEKLLHILLAPERLRGEWYEGTSGFFRVLDAVLSRVNAGGFSHEEIEQLPDVVGPELEIMLHHHDFQFRRIRLPLGKKTDLVEGSEGVTPAGIARSLRRSAANRSLHD